VVLKLAVMAEIQISGLYVMVMVELEGLVDQQELEEQLGQVQAEI
jgi:hypothetical protein